MLATGETDAGRKPSTEPAAADQNVNNEESDWSYCRHSWTALKGQPAQRLDKKWISTKDSSSVLYSSTGDQSQLSKDGKSNNAFGLLQWAPDSKNSGLWQISLLRPAMST